VDDEAPIRALLGRALREEGYEVAAVTDGKAGLNAAKTAAKPYDLVITNSYMPHLTGEQLIAHLQQLFPSLPILHLDDLSRQLDLGGLGVPSLKKPFSLDDLLGEVRRLLGRRVAGQHLDACNSPRKFSYAAVRSRRTSATSSPGKKGLRSSRPGTNDGCKP
jgi:DNA-binding response OmpR family regulator